MIAHAWTSRRLQAHANTVLSQALAQRTSRLFVMSARADTDGVVFATQLHTFDATDPVTVPQCIKEMSLALLPPEAARDVARAKAWLEGWGLWLARQDAAWFDAPARLPIDFVPSNAFATFLDPKLASAEAFGAALSSH